MKQATECLKMKPSLADCLQKRDGQDDALFARWDQSLSKNIARLFGLMTLRTFRITRRPDELS